MKKSKLNSCLDEEVSTQAASVIRNGGVVAFPTETYYGLAVDPFNETAIQKLFSIKERPTQKPILLLVENICQLSSITESIPEVYLPLLEKYWPGPLTLIFKAGKNISPKLTGGLGTIGVRISSHPFANRLCRKWNNPLTATSANISGMPPARTASQVSKIFGNKIDHIIDCGSTPAGLCSTIVDIEMGRLKLIRKGQIDFNKLVNDTF